jgi:hypothetical protein
MTFPLCRFRIRTLMIAVAAVAFDLTGLLYGPPRVMFLCVPTRLSPQPKRKGGLFTSPLAKGGYRGVLPRRALGPGPPLAPPSQGGE